MKERFLPAVVRRAAAVMYSCEKNRRYFRHFGAREAQLFPILSTVDNAYYLGLAPRRAAFRAATRAALGIPDDAIVAMFSGRMTPRKRAADLLAAFRRLAGDHPRLWVLFVGDGSERAGMEADAAGCDHVVFAGFQNQSELPKYYFAADIFVMPSEWDPTPKALNEALICGLPAIVTVGVGQAGDLVREGENGVVYPVGDVAALAAGLAMLAGNDALRHAYGATATAAARAWSPEANVAGLKAALDYAFKTKSSRTG